MLFCFCVFVVVVCLFWFFRHVFCHQKQLQQLLGFYFLWPQVTMNVFNMVIPGFVSFTLEILTSRIINRK